MHACCGHSFFYLEANARFHERTSFTGQRCQWIMPKFQRTMEYAEVGDIDFVSANGKRKRTASVESPGPVVTEKMSQRSSASTGVQVPSLSEQALFYTSISKSR